MPEVPLPVFQIQDFDQPRLRADDFYLSSFEQHLARHAFLEKPHRHDFYLVLFITRGSGTHTIDFETYPVQAGALYFLSPGQVHSWQASEDTTGYILFFARDFYLLGFPNKKLLSYPIFNPLFSPFLVLAPESITTFQELFQPMLQEYQGQAYNRADMLRNLTDNLLIYASRHYLQHHKGAFQTTGHYQTLQQLEALIEQQLTAHQPVSYYAGALHLSQRQLNDICRQSLGKTISELIHGRVILEARRLLLHSELTVTQIAGELGYFDNSYFTRFFRRHTGETPEQFRAKHANPF